MGALWVFRFFDGTVETVRDGGLGKSWVIEFARASFPITEIWQVSGPNNYIRPGYEFFSHS